MRTFTNRCGDMRGKLPFFKNPCEDMNYPQRRTLLGGVLLVNGPALDVLRFIGQGWPLVLIAIGLYLILRRREIKE